MPRQGVGFGGNRTCVFCGDAPANESDEHVIPQWLMKATGSPNRTVSFGLNPERNELVRFGFKGFTAPACVACNTAWADLEGQAKRVVTTLRATNTLSREDTVVLLDWLDKVRVGVWLALRLLHGNPFAVDRPLFGITKRVGSADRMVHVFRFLSDHPDGITFMGTALPLFGIMPSAWCLRVGDFAFLNASAPFLFSKRAGFPFPTACETDEGDRVAYYLEDALGRIERPLLVSCPPYGSANLYQPVSPAADESAYVRETAFAVERGLGPVIHDDGVDTRILRPGEVLELAPVGGVDLLRACLELQNNVAQTTMPWQAPDYAGSLPEPYATAVEVNRQLIERWESSGTG